MLSLQQALEIKASITEYLKATFTFQDKTVHQAFYDFVNHPQEGLFKGPYVSLKLPFVKAQPEEIAQIPLTIQPNWAPYDHQVKAWNRLSTQNKEPEPTIVTTGTGSGKTEAFLYPLLDYCHQHRSRPGIKAIILYPMNALATDQARRLAEMIHEDPRLRGSITAGLFIGEGRDGKNFPKSMGENHIIENRSSILDAPPDILLTNFKMLDYGLMKSDFHPLWIQNLKEQDLLRYLVLDELHTYDGAQGTDVANLIRRLKLKLELPPGQLCPVGTSATIGSGEDAPGLLADFTSAVFGEAIFPEAIITENRQETDAFFGPRPSLEKFLPRASRLKNSSLQPNEGYADFIARQLDTWQLNADNLADDLRKLGIVYDLVDSCNTGKGLHTLPELEQMLSKRNSYFQAIPQWDEAEKFSPKTALLESLFALISQAKETDENGRESPFIFTQAQLWIRELSGVLRSVQEPPQFTWKDHVEGAAAVKALPPWYCRECGASGWLAVKHDNKTRFELDINDVYEKYFSNHKHIFFVNRQSWLNLADMQKSGYEPNDVVQKQVYGRNLEFYDEAAEGRMAFIATRKLKTNGRNDHVCPECNTRNSTAIIGTRVATLSSIGISQTLATDLDEQNEQNRKVLAFTNAVQDAAHQAGFVEARNFRFTLRSSLQKVINQHQELVPLNRLADRFMDYWKANSDETGQQPLKAYYYRFYPSDYLGKSTPADYQRKGKYTKDFVAEFDNRVRWEVYAEFGYNALIGRTLEKTGSSAVQFDTTDFPQLWTNMQAWLETNETSQTINEQEFLRFVLLMLHRIRIRGAIDHPFLAKYRSNDLKLWDLNWTRDKRHFLHRYFGSRARLPKLIGYQPDKRGLLDSTHSQAVNWFHAYFTKSFEQANNHRDFLNDFFEQLLQELLSTGILDSQKAGESINFALNPGKLLVGKNVQVLTCKSCGHQLHLIPGAVNLEGGLCLTYRCTGNYEQEHDGTVPNYYQLVYNRNRSPRIYATDHTGLLDRKDREDIESDFKERTKFNSKNAMVATSTLEMGIDIGDLNTAFNNSVPPYPANFMQRVGRAGRKSGSALLVNFAQNKAHDLFYFKEPLEMMAGDVATPGCFLAAKEILKRHFFAFCIDSWTSNNPVQHHIPGRILQMKLALANLEDPDFFMNRLLTFVSSRESQLLAAFQAQYSEAVHEEVFDTLKSWVQTQGFDNEHRKIFKKIKDEIHNIRDQQKALEKRIEEEKWGENDQDYIEHKKEITNLGGLITSIGKRFTLEHLTNVGVLPNYAFPETGVTLSATVLSNQPVGGLHAPPTKDFELVRAAGQAIREFAPDNFFYSQGFRFQITGLNTFDWADPENSHRKRFCSNCDHLEIEETAPKGSCPKCGDASWEAASNVHRFARLTKVKSFNNRSKATIADQKDERQSEHYRINQHFHFNNSSHGAWAMKDIPFGIEFAKNVRITDVNLGKSEAHDARRLRINDTEVPVHGFVTCRHCGKSSSHFRQQDYQYHYGFCKHKAVEYEGASNKVFEELYFFRQITTEVLKILLPTQEFNSEAEILMFKAGIELGLKKYYQGNPQHISLTDYREYNHQTLRFDRYLILFDTVPGGTGYLEKLFDWKQFNHLLHQAYESIRHCDCQHHGNDGCYRCIYSYSNQYQRGDLSRQVAENRFREIIDQAEGWEHHPAGLGQVADAGQIEESELEKRFVAALEKYASLDNGWSFERANEDGTISYKLTYSNDQILLLYHLRPQIELGPSQGIAYHTRTDFLLVCTGGKVEGKPMNEEVWQSIPRIAIYLDGYRYHASEEHNRFATDIRQRDAIRQHPEYYTWTLTWTDLDHFMQAFVDENHRKSRSDSLFDRLNEEGFGNTKKQLLRPLKGDQIQVHAAQNNLERLLKVLEFPLQNKKFKISWSALLALYQQELFVPSVSPEQREFAFSPAASMERYCIEQKTPNGYLFFQGLDDGPLHRSTTIINIATQDVETRMQVLLPESIDKLLWNHFWSCFNLLQFFPMTVDFEEKASVESTKLQPESLILEAAQQIDLAELLPLYDTVFHQVLEKLHAGEYLKTEADEMALNTLLDEAGIVVAEAELIIAHLQVAVNPLDEASTKQFSKRGYQIIAASSLQNLSV